MENLNSKSTINKYFKLNIWRTHPEGVRIVKAEKTLNNTAHPGAVKFCGPFTDANSYGFWIFPAHDIDICWHGGSEFEVKMLDEYDASDHYVMRNLLKETDNTDLNKWCPAEGGRTKYSFGAVEEGVVQIYTGVILQTPPGWVLHLRNPINFEPQAYHVMEGILPTDWMQYDLWTNLKFDQKHVWVHIRRDQWPPLAQIIPIRRESISLEWEIGRDEMINRGDVEAERVFNYYVEYNTKKYCRGGRQRFSPVDPSLTKNASTFHRERVRMVPKGNYEPDQEVLKPKQRKVVKPKYIKRPTQ